MTEVLERPTSIAEQVAQDMEAKINAWLATENIEVVKVRIENLRFAEVASYFLEHMPHRPSEVKKAIRKTAVWNKLVQLAQELTGNGCPAVPIAKCEPTEGIYEKRARVSVELIDPAILEGR